MIKSNSKSENECFEHPEGVQVAIEILENIPEDMLDEFYTKVIMFPEINHMEHWKKIVENWYSNKTNTND